jgi:pimeloyl-ACP methyl ester carboxylesterase
MGFAAFQRLCSQWCFEPSYYAAHADRFLGRHGPWSHLADNLEAMDRLIEATITHDASAGVATITAPTFVVHADHDLLTGPRLTRPLQAAIPHATGVHLPLPHVVAGREAKKSFSDALGAFLDSVEND